MTKNLERRQDFIRGRRNKRKQARHARTRRQILRYTLLLAMVGVAVCGFTRLPWTISDTQNDVIVHGNHVVSDSQVRQAVASAVKKPLYNVDPRKLQNNLCALPAVRQAFVRRYIFPQPHLRIEIMEEFPWASYSTAPNLPPEGVISQTGRYIPLSNFPAAVQPALRFSGAQSLKMKPADITQWDQWCRLIEAQTGQPVSLVDMSVPSAVEAYTGGYDLHLGAVDSSLQRRIGRLASVMPTIASMKDPVKYIDLSLDSNIPLKIDKTAKAQRSNDSSLLPTDHSSPISTAPSVASSSTVPSF